jgi:dCTP deaminase
MGVLTKSKIWKKLRDGQSEKGLVITPLVRGGDEIGTSSVDVHLGHEFIVFRRAKTISIDVKDSSKSDVKDSLKSDEKDRSKFSENIYRYQEKMRISRGQKFVLHPHQLVLGSSIEYVSLPDNLSGNIIGRSTWGRTGLIIATATKIDPCFKGCVTLELVNEGEVPLVLYPGLCVAQIVFTTTDGTATYDGEYKCPTGPEFPKLDKEEEKLTSFYKPG